MKYYGKEKCRILKQIRAEIARANDIEWVVSECKHKGNCKGTCPKCEQEVRQLETALARREALGKTVAVVGVSASIALSVTGCINPFPQTTDGVAVEMGNLLPPESFVEETHVAVAGEMLPPETESDTVCDLPLAGVPVQETEEVLMGDVPVEGELIEETAVEGEFIEEMGEMIEEITEEATEELTEETAAHTAEETETEEEPLMGEPMA